MGREWTDEQKAAASEAYKARAEGKKTSETRKRLRVGAGQKRDILSIPARDDGYRYRVVNDTGSRIENLKERGYDMVEDDIELGTSHVDGNSAYAGIVSRQVGKGVTAYLMRQKDEYFAEDKSDKARLVDETEESMMRKKVNSHESTDGTYGEVKIGKP